jgi:protein-tyrosine phosphatase
MASKSSLASRRNHGCRLKPSLSVDYNCCQILPHLYLGGHEMTTEVDMLHQLDVSHILSITVDSYNHFPGEFTYRQFNLLDSAEANLLEILEPAFAIIDAAKIKGKAAYVHCSFGMSRSPSVVMAYLMKSERISLSAAFQKVKKLRPVTAPNYGFIEKLVGYEKELFGKFCVM